MDTLYKLIISNNRLYKEYQIDDSKDQFVLGTYVDNDIRFKKDLFLEPFQIEIVLENKQWVMYCSDEVYIDKGDGRKLLTTILEHGDTYGLRYQSHDELVFTYTFCIDFDYETKHFNQYIDLSQVRQITVGYSSQYDIDIRDSMIKDEAFTISVGERYSSLIVNKSRYGIYKNAKRVARQSKLQDRDFITVGKYAFYLKKRRLYLTCSKNIYCHIKSVNIIRENDALKYPHFNRNTRILYQLPVVELEIKQPPAKINKNRRSFMMTLIPAIAMFAAMIILRGVMGGGGTFIIYSVFTMGIGIVVSIMTFIQEKKQYQKDVQERRNHYLEYIAEKQKEIEKYREIEIQTNLFNHPSLNQSIDEVISFGKRIFEVGKKDKDFLDVFIGKGTQTSALPIRYTKQDFIDKEDDLSQLPEMLSQNYKYIQDIPIMTHLKTINCLGVVGKITQLNEFMKNMTLDLSIRYFYKDVYLYYLIDEKDIEIFEWLKWIKNVKNPSLGIRHMMCDDESRHIILEMLYSEILYRESLHLDEEIGDFETNHVIFVRDAQYMKNHPISQYFEKCSQYGFTFIFFEEYEELLMRGCGEIIFLNDEKKRIFTHNGSICDVFDYPVISYKQAAYIARRLAGIELDEVSLESELTKNITLFELLHILEVEDLNLKERWLNSNVYQTMSAPIGVKNKGEVVYLDISDQASAHGPHGLIAGTTGSGKSEIIQTYVLSMATLFHPYDVGFVIIDFKGGGMANQFKDLPHVMGTITNIDGREIQRSLLSIKAELTKRQEMFSKVGVNHINDYIKLYKNHKTDTPLPHLIMIVDEFAELKAEYPDFMKEIISAARIGRTLGIHLILATQKPSGVVDNQIWSNSKFKLCLKVQSKEDSMEVIKSPLAADLVEAGRAYFQVGNNEVFDLFQSAYSGAKVYESKDKTEHIYQVYEVNIWGKKELIYTNKKDINEDTLPNELDTIVDYIYHYCETMNIHKLQGICLPSLDDIVVVNVLKVNQDIYKSKSKLNVDCGIFDDPECQRQEDYIVDLAEGHTYIIGSSQTGKTTLLQTILLQLIQHYTPKDVFIYIIDCGNMALRVFENSNLVGGVVTYQEEERVGNLFKLIYRFIEQRKEQISSKGLGTYNAYIEAGYEDLPRIVMMIDNIAAFREYYPDYDDHLLYISRECQSIGIHLIITGTQTTHLGYRVLANFGTKIALNCVDSNEYGNLFGKCRITPKEIPGRGLCQIDKRILEFQTLLSVEGNHEHTRNQNMMTCIMERNTYYPLQTAIVIPSVPKILKTSYLTTEYLQSLDQYIIPYGIDYKNVHMNYLDLTSLGLLGLLGNKNRVCFMQYIITFLNDHIQQMPNEIYILDTLDQDLEQVSQLHNVKEYRIDPIDAEMIIATIYETISTRFQYIINHRDISRETYLKKQPLLVFVINNRALLASLQNQIELYEQFLYIFKERYDMKALVIFGDVENIPNSFNTVDFLKQMKEINNVIAFENIDDIKFLDIPLKVTKMERKPLDAGDAFVSIKNQYLRVKTISNEEEKYE